MYKVKFKVFGGSVVTCGIILDLSSTALPIMLPRPALGATNAQRKGGLRTRSHNDDRTKGT
jgi:hypothetical protein